MARAVIKAVIKAIIKALAAQLQNKERKAKRKWINKQFAENPRKVYRDMAGDAIEVQQPPDKEDLEQFWRPLYEDQKNTPGECLDEHHQGKKPQKKQHVHPNEEGDQGKTESIQ